MRIAALMAVAVFAPLCQAQYDPGLKLGFSSSVDGPWMDDIAVTPGSRVYVQVRSTVPVQFWGGIAGVKFNITSESGEWDVGGDDAIDLVPGKGSATDARIDGYDFGSAAQEVFEGDGTLRIDAKNDVTDQWAAGISVSRMVPSDCDLCDPHFAVVYRFAVDLHDGPAERFLTLRIADGEQFGAVDQIRSFKGFQLINNSWQAVAITGETGDEGTIHVIPSAGSAAMLGLAALAAGRRRGK